MERKSEKVAMKLVPFPPQTKYLSQPRLAILNKLLATPSLTEATVLAGQWPFASNRIIPFRMHDAGSAAQPSSTGHYTAASSTV